MLHFPTAFPEVFLRERAGFDVILGNPPWKEAKVEEDYARFRQQVLVAVEEVERALVSHRQRQLEQAHLVEAVASARRAVELARVLHERGLDDFLTVLDAERTLRSVEDRLATSEIAVSLQVVAIYKALGGGWQVADVGLATARSTRHTQS